MYKNIFQISVLTYKSVRKLENLKREVEINFNYTKIHLTSKFYFEVFSD